VTAIPRPGAILEKTPEVIRALVVIEDEDTRKTFDQVLEEAGAEFQTEAGGISLTVDYLAGGASSPPLVVVDIENSENPMADIDALAEVCNPGTSVIAVGRQNDVDLFRNLVAFGVVDYLVKPCGEDNIRSAVTNAMRPPEQANDKEIGKAGKTVVVIGARGGVGASTVAVNAGWIVSQRLDQRVALLDLDLFYGTATFALDLEPGRGLRDALEHPDRVDSLFISSVGVPAHERFHIFGSEESLEGSFELDPNALDLLTSELRHDFRTVVIDMPRHLVGTTTELLSVADQIIIVTDMSLNGTRDTMRLVSALKNIAVGADLKVVVNRVPMNGKGPIKRADFEKGIEHKVDYIIPEDAKAVSLAANAGRPLAVAAKKSKAVAAMRLLCDDIAGVPPKDKAGPPWLRLFKKK
jgi:pilus assembly protein CpaE